MLSATVSRTILETVVAPLIVLGSDEVLEITPDGLTIHATDKSREAIIELWLPETCFESYRASPMETGISLAKVAEFLAVAQDTTRIHIEIDAERKQVTLIGNQLTYTFSLLDTTSIPRRFAPRDTAQPASVTLKTQKLDVPLRLACLAGSRIQLNIDSEEPSFTGITNDARDTLVFEIGPNDLMQRQGASNGVPISLDYLTPIQETIPQDTHLGIMLGNTREVRLQYPISGDGGSVTVTFAGLPQ